MTCTARGPHGSLRAYVDRGCRCPEAVEKNRARKPSRRRYARRETSPKTVARINAVAHLDTRGLSAGQIAERLGLHRDTVRRYRARLRAQILESA